MDGDARMKWFEKVGTNAIPNELKFKYERIQERVDIGKKSKTDLVKLYFFVGLYSSVQLST